MILKIMWISLAFNHICCLNRGYSQYAVPTYIGYVCRYHILIPARSLYNILVIPVYKTSLSNWLLLDTKVTAYAPGRIWLILSWMVMTVIGLEIHQYTILQNLLSLPYTCYSRHHEWGYQGCIQSIYYSWYNLTCWYYAIQNIDHNVIGVSKRSCPMCACILQLLEDPASGPILVQGLHKTVYPCTLPV